MAFALSFQSCPTLWDPRLFCPWDCPSKDTGVDCHFLLQETFPGIKPSSLRLPILAGGFFTTSIIWEALWYVQAVANRLGLCQKLVFLQRTQKSGFLMWLPFKKFSNMHIIICETDRQSRFDAWDRVLWAGALGWPWRMGWGGRWERGSGWGTHVHPWLIHVSVWQKPLQ